MTVPMGSLTESEMGTWLFRVGIAVIGFLLAIAVKDAKKVIDLVPSLQTKIVDLEKVIDRLLSRVTELEQEARKGKR